MQKKILLVDDEIELLEQVSELLSHYNYEVFIAQKTEEVFEKIKAHLPDLVLLDIMMPGTNGFDLCKEIRKISKVPIIILSACGQIEDKVLGLELGADDYISKPFEPKELIARIRSIFRRIEGIPSNFTEGKILRSNNLLLDINRASVLLDEKPIDLTTMEFEILSLFMRNPGITLSREEVVDKVRGMEWDSIDRTIDVLISRLRSKLKDDVKNPKFLKTIWGSGYRFVGEVTQ